MGCSAPPVPRHPQRAPHHPSLPCARQQASPAGCRGHCQPPFPARLPPPPQAPAQGARSGLPPVAWALQPVGSCWAGPGQGTLGAPQTAPWVTLASHAHAFLGRRPQPQPSAPLLPPPLAQPQPPTHCRPALQSPYPLCQCCHCCAAWGGPPAWQAPVRGPGTSREGWRSRAAWRRASSRPDPQHHPCLPPPPSPPHLALASAPPPLTPPTLAVPFQAVAAAPLLEGAVAAPLAVPAHRQRQQGSCRWAGQARRAPAGHRVTAAQVPEPLDLPWVMVAPALALAVAGAGRARAAGRERAGGRGAAEGATAAVAAAPAARAAAGGAAGRAPQVAVPPAASRRPWLQYRRSRAAGQRCGRRPHASEGWAAAGTALGSAAASASGTASPPGVPASPLP